jgi:uncharacterized cofD-like protein
MKFKNGKKLIGESKIYESDEIKKEEIKDVFLRPEAKANPEAVEKIKKADLVVICPGNIYCSLLPNFLIKDIAEAIRKSKAKTVYVCNLVNKTGQTDSFDMDDYVEMLNDALGGGEIDYVLYNTGKPSEATLEKYKKAGEFLVKFQENKNPNRQYKVIKANLIADYPISVDKNTSADFLASKRSLIRHDSDKLAIVIDYIAGMEELGNIIEEVK